MGEMKRVRHNYLAIGAAAIACFLFEAVWYTIFQQAWLDGIGRTIASLQAIGVNPGLQYATAFLAAVLLAIAISCVIQLTGEQTTVRGMKVGLFLWLGFVLTTWATEYVFEERTYELFAINLGFWLLAMVLMGAIVGGWKKKA